jgi:hypothetical protein
MKNKSLSFSTESYKFFMCGSEDLSRSSMLLSLNQETEIIGRPSNLKRTAETKEPEMKGPETKAKTGTKGPILKLPQTLPNREYKTRSRLSYEEILNENSTKTGSYSAKIIKKMEEIGASLTDEQIFSIFHHILANVDKAAQSDYFYWWSTYFQGLQHVSDGFYNRYIDITASILLKCYEFLTLKPSEKINQTELTRLQAQLELIVVLLIAKITRENHKALSDEILTSNLPCSQVHQYDPDSLNYYILRNLSTAS